MFVEEAMAKKRAKAARSKPRKVAKKTRAKREDLSRAELVKASKEATRAAFKRAVNLMGTLLVKRDGWLVRVDSKGNVVEKVKPIQSALDDRGVFILR